MYISHCTILTKPERAPTVGRRDLFPSFVKPYLGQTKENKRISRFQYLTTVFVLISISVLALCPVFVQEMLARRSGNYIASFFRDRLIDVWIL